MPRNISELIERFARNREAYLSGRYNETQLRREFLDPLFISLGWDIDNKQGYAEAYKDVIHEDAIKVGGVIKAPDYCFRIGGTRKFFVEAKKPSVKLKDDVSPAFQLRRYAWSAKLPLSILTDFEEFAVYDCRVKPVKTDKASKARILYLTYNEYDQKWDEISSVFSRDAVLKGSFDKYAGKGRHKKGTAEVDSAFLHEIEVWREMFARNFALRNHGLTQRELNFAVQRTIDRIIFLRICEDRGIEEYGRLMSLLNGANVYKRLFQIFRNADERYNSGLFHFEKEKNRHESPDDLTPSLNIDDKLLKEIIKRLYYPESPYEFSVLPADILGQVYEQFLGKVIRLTAGHRAIVEEKPEVRKAGGVYYTPTYIVDYIVKNTVGHLVGTNTVNSITPTLAKGGKGGFSTKNISPKEVSKLRILDPACGSGSFLLGAYQYLLDWHRDWYISNDPQKRATGRKPALYQALGGDWHLTTAEKKRILLNNIYGVDIDSQAVEVTKLSLLLKVLEGESNQTLERQLKFFRERALPDLGDNIKCGNSLIGPDFYEQQTLPDEEERYRINVFDWNAEFPEIIKRGGFNAVIGNPPYGVPFSEAEIDYLQRHFLQAQKFLDSYCLFIVKAVRLLRTTGITSFIVPNTFCDLENCDAFRKWLLTEQTLTEIWQTGWAFKSAVVDTLVFFITNRKHDKTDEISIIVDDRKYRRTVGNFMDNDLQKIDYRNTENDRALLKDVFRESTKLGDIASVKAGVKMYERGKGAPPQTAAIIKQRPYSVEGKCPKDWKPLYRGDYIARYYLTTPNEFVNYGPWLAAPRDTALFDSPKILMRRTDDRLRSIIETEAAICVNSCHVIKLIDPKSMSYSYMLGILNSRLLQKIFALQNPQMINKVFAEIKVIYVKRLPIRLINFTDPADIARHDKMVSLVEQMLSLNKKLSAAKTDHEKTSLQRQTDATDKQIDKLVYELYGLTEEEIRIVEGN